MKRLVRRTKQLGSAFVPVDAVERALATSDSTPEELLAELAAAEKDVNLLMGLLRKALVREERARTEVEKLDA